ncbi:DUF551 domain-containing protein [Pseudocitrobacter faecalis]|nr:DUF551 domain-containing protein [Pseudocitrobacter faecalis]
MTTPITKERLEELANFRGAPVSRREEQTLARIALAAMNAKPVAYMWDSDRKDVDAAGYYRPEHKIFAESSVKRYGGKVVPLYATPPVSVVQCPFPCGWNNLNKLAIQDAAFVSLGLVEGEVVTEAYRQAIIANNDRLLKVIASCRDFMLQGGKS